MLKQNKNKNTPFDILLRSYGYEDRKSVSRKLAMIELGISNETEIVDEKKFGR